MNTPLECQSRVLGKVAGSSPVQSAQIPTFGEANLQGFFLFLDMTYHVYILQSLSNGSYYIGYTKDLNKRFLQHNKAKTGYSAKKIPWELVYSESFDDKTEAILRERFIKAQKSRDFIRKLIAHEI